MNVDPIVTLARCRSYLREAASDGSVRELVKHKTLGESPDPGGLVPP
jgi:hypothetical protein